MTRQDTGHPFGLLRVLIHQDGHVAMSATASTLVPKVEAMHALLAEVGLAGWRLGWLTTEDTAAAYIGGLGCPRCAMRVSCGCDIMQDVLTGRCPHGTAQAFYDAATRTGYRDVGPYPPGGDPQARDQGALDEYARAMVEVDRTQKDIDGALNRRRRRKGRKGRRGSAS